MKKEDKATVCGVAGSGVGVAASVGAVVAAGGGTSAAGLTSGLSALGSILGLGMTGGLVVVAAIPLALTGVGYCIAKAVSNDD